MSGAASREIRSGVAPTVAALLVLLSSCGGGITGTTVTTPPTTAAPTTTEAPATTQSPTTTDGAPSHTTPEGLFTLGEPSLVPPVPIGADEASGSGCPPAEFLPDGIWFGFALSVTPQGIDLDPACFFFGDEVAARAAAEDGAEEPPNPFYIRNSDATTISILTAADTLVQAIVATDELRFESTPFEEWPDSGYTPCPGEFCTVWVALNEGTITEVMEQYIP